MDWIKHFVIQRSDKNLRVNGLKQGICFYYRYGNAAMNIYERVDGKKEGYYCSLYNTNNENNAGLFYHISLCVKNKFVKGSGICCDPDGTITRYMD